MPTLKMAPLRLGAVCSVAFAVAALLMGPAGAAAPPVSAGPPLGSQEAPQNTAPAGGSPPSASPAQSSTPTAPSAAVNSAIGLPPLQPGLWEYRRTQMASASGKPQTQTLRKCSDPNVEFSRKMEQLRQRGCVFTPLKHHGNSYEATWRCDLGDGRVIAMRDIVTVNGPTSYQDESDAVVAHEVTHTSVLANRQGDCPPRNAPPSRPTPLKPR